MKKVVLSKKYVIHFFRNIESFELFAIESNSFSTKKSKFLMGISWIIWKICILSQKLNKVVASEKTKKILFLYFLHNEYGASYDLLMVNFCSSILNLKDSKWNSRKTFSRKILKVFLKYIIRPSLKKSLAWNLSELW